MPTIRKGKNQNQAKAHEALHSIIETRWHTSNNDYSPITAAALFQEFSLSGLDYKGQVSTGFGEAGKHRGLSVKVDVGKFFKLHELLKLSATASGAYEHVHHALLMIQRQSQQLTSQPICLMQFTGQRRKIKAGLELEVGVKTPDSGEILDLGPDEMSLNLSISGQAGAEYDGEHLIAVDPGPTWYGSSLDSSLLADFAQLVGPSSEDDLRRNVAEWMAMYGFSSRIGIKDENYRPIDLNKEQIKQVAREYMALTKHKLHLLENKIKGHSPSSEPDQPLTLPTPLTEDLIKGLDKIKELVPKEAWSRRAIGLQAAYAEIGQSYRPLSYDEFRNQLEEYKTRLTKRVAFKKRLTTWMKQNKFDPNPDEKSTLADLQERLDEITKRVVSDPKFREEFVNFQRELKKLLANETADAAKRLGAPWEHLCHLNLWGHEGKGKLGGEIKIPIPGAKERKDFLEGFLKQTRYHLQTWVRRSARLNGPPVICTQKTVINYKQLVMPTSDHKDPLWQRDLRTVDTSGEFAGNILHNSMSYRSAVVFWEYPLRGLPITETTNKNCLPGSGISYGVSVQLRRLVKLMEALSKIQPVDGIIRIRDPWRKPLKALAQGLHVTEQDLIRFCRSSWLKDAYAPVSNTKKPDEKKGVVTEEDIGFPTDVVLLESSFVVPPNTPVALVQENQDDVTMSGVDKELFDKLEKPEKNFELQAIRVRYRIADFKANFKASKINKVWDIAVKFPLGLFTGIEPGIDLTRVDRAGMLGVVDLYTHWMSKDLAIYNTPGATVIVNGRKEKVNPKVPYEKGVPPVVLLHQ